MKQETIVNLIDRVSVWLIDLMIFLLVILVVHHGCRYLGVE